MQTLHFCSEREGLFCSFLCGSFQVSGLFGLCRPPLVAAFFFLFSFFSPVLLPLSRGAGPLFQSYVANMFDIVEAPRRATRKAVKGLGLKRKKTCPAQLL